MSLITRCPACGTMFKVVPDHLRISDGWVRCGQCSEVFDAREHLQQRMPKTAVDTREGIAVADRGTPISQQYSVTGGGGETKTDEPALTESDQPLLPPVPGPFGDTGEILAPEPARVESEESEAQDMQEGQDAAAQPEPGLEVRDEEEVAVDAAVAPAVPAASVGTDEKREAWSEPDSVLDEDLAFVREARRRAFWHGPLVRGGLLFLIFALLCLLGVQVLIQERDNLAAANPQLKPWLVRLCVPLNCSVSVPRRIDAVLIDSSAFNKVAPDTYRLTFTIRNSANFDVATPAVEVTLTDFQDQALLRRVFLPADLGGRLAIGPAAEWGPVVHMHVTASGIGGRVAGYRLFAFYP